MAGRPITTWCASAHTAIGLSICRDDVPMSERRHGRAAPSVSAATGLPRGENSANPSAKAASAPILGKGSARRSLPISMREKTNLSGTAPQARNCVPIGVPQRASIEETAASAAAGRTAIGRGIATHSASEGL